MKRFQLAFAAASLSIVLIGSARADEKEVTAVLDKAIKALGGEEKLAKAAGFSWKTKGTLTFNDSDNPISGQATLKGIGHYRNEFEGEFGGNQFKGVTVLSGDKGWRKIGEMLMELDGDALASERRTVYLQAVPNSVLPLKGKGFKVESGGEEKVDDKPAVVLKVTGPDGKDFQISFDKESGLPVKQVAKVSGFNGDEFTQETTFKDYKDFGGIKKATKVESKRDGEKFLVAEISDFKALDKVDDATFAEPK